MQISQFSCLTQSKVTWNVDPCSSVCLHSELDTHDTLNELPKEEIVYSLLSQSFLCNYPLQDCCNTEIGSLWTFSSWASLFLKTVMIRIEN